MPHARKAGFAAVLVATFFLGGSVLRDADQEKGPNLFRDVLTLVSTRYVDTLDVSEVYERAAEGLVDHLEDPYADLFSPEEIEDFTATYEGHYAGVGMLIEAQQDAAVVRRVFPNTPAERIGAQVGDRIVAIDGRRVAGWPLEKVADALKGEPGTEVAVIFLRFGVDAPIDVDITRAVVRIPAVPYSATVAEDVGYIPLQQFNETAADEVAAAIGELVDAGVAGLVLDLRGNRGGIVDQAVRIAGMFLPRESEIARQSERGSEDTEYLNDTGPLAPDVPLVVLIDGRSASASEIVAGALQDHDRAVVIGTTSFGKGLVQTAYRVEGGYVLKMTTGKWFTPNGRSIHRERTLVDGRLVEVEDSVHFAAGRDIRPVYRSDAGRVVYGGGGIMPDLEVQDTLPTPEQALVEAILPHSPAFYTTLFDYANELQRTVERDFQVTAAWRDELYARLLARQVEIDRAVYADGAAYIDRFLGSRVASMAFGDAFARTRDVGSDGPLLRAIEVIHGGGSRQSDLFGYVERIAAGKGE